MTTTEASASVPRTLSTRRLEAFTDGVFAIAATLLVLNLSVDAIGSVNSNAELWHALVEQGPAIQSFVISFLLLGLLWSLHVRQFEYIIAVDSIMIWLNIIRLLGVVFVPFATSLNSGYSDYLIGQMVLPVTFLFVIVFGTWQWYYATTPARHLLQPHTDPAFVSANRIGGIVAVITGIIVVALSAFVGSYAFLLFALGPLGTRLARLASRGRTHKTGPHDS